MRAGERSPASVLVLGIVTFGFYFAVYYFKAFREIDFAAGRRHSGMLILGLIPFVGFGFIIAYLVVEIGNLSSDRSRVGLDPPLSPIEHTGLHAVALVPAVVTGLLWYDTQWLVLVPIVLLLWSPAVPAPFLARDIRAYWARWHRRAAAPPPVASATKPAA